MNEYELIERIKALHEEYSAGINHMDAETKSIMFPSFINELAEILEEHEEV